MTIALNAMLMIQQNALAVKRDSFYSIKTVNPAKLKTVCDVMPKVFVRNVKRATFLHRQIQARLFV